jgi:hypothetical protein
MKFRTMTVSVEPASNGKVKVDVSYAPDVSIETLTFADHRHNIQQLDGLRVSATEVVAWLTSRGKTWEDWNAREYLEHRMDAALPSG